MPADPRATGQELYLLERAGFFVRRGVFAPLWIRAARRCIPSARAADGPLSRLAHDPRTHALAADILGPAARIGAVTARDGDVIEPGGWRRVGDPGDQETIRFTAPLARWVRLIVPGSHAPGYLETSDPAREAVRAAVVPGDLLVWRPALLHRDIIRAPRLEVEATAAPPDGPGTTLTAHVVARRAAPSVPVSDGT